MTKPKQILFCFVVFTIVFLFAMCNSSHGNNQEEKTSDEISIDKIINTLKNGDEKERDKLYEHYNLNPKKYKELIKAVLAKTKDNSQMMKTCLTGLQYLIKHWAYANLSDSFTKDIIFSYCDYLNHDWSGCLVAHKEGDSFMLSELKIPDAQYLTYIKAMDIDGDKKDEIIIYSNHHRGAHLFVYKWENGAFKEFFHASLGESRFYSFFTRDNNEVYSIKCNVIRELYEEEEAIFELKDGIYVRTK